MPSQNSSKLPICRACGSNRLDYLWNCAPFSDRLLAEMGQSSLSAGKLYKCQHCGLGQRLPCLTEEELKQVYASAPSGAMDYEFERNAAWSKGRELLLKHFSGHQAVTVLDVGCNEGKFLANLPEHWQWFGVEGGEATAQSASAKGVQVIANRVQDVHCQWHHYFDVLTLFDVFEHLPNPLEGIQQAKQLLKPGGLLLISTGNMDAWTWRWLRGRHWYLQTPLHLSFATRQFFSYVEQIVGVKIQQIDSIPHQLGARQEVWDDCIKAIYYECWQRGGFWRFPQKAILSMPNYSHLRHLTSVPWTVKLSDHFFICLRNA
ncbi:class I SAM-dependent methyltransferase [Synechocystis salina LEGE 06099]|uniref:class I SAM-dependent methyltransferase n=1 Tax=Synechocystis salina TaxID=945780 RepID=UPI00187FFD45|nr:class I SAM-dependent methyltransferase [Synechocystis salina]MBE9203879.1 class I SAM-dependent methyltransferase [Synechocystis salina LEGE 06099]